MVVVHLDVAHHFHLQVKEAVFGEEGQHVVKKRYASVNLRDTSTVHHELDLDVGLSGLAGEGCGAGLLHVGSH